MVLVLRVVVVVLQPGGRGGPGIRRTEGGGGAAAVEEELQADREYMGIWLKYLLTTTHLMIHICSLHIKRGPSAPPPPPPQGCEPQPP